MKKNRPRRSQRKKKKQRSERGLNPQALSEGGNKQLIAKNHSKKNDQRTLDKAQETLYPTAPEQSTDWKDIHKIDTFIAHHPRAIASPRRRHEMNTAGNEPRRPSSPSIRHDKRGGKRDERSGEMSGTEGEPQQPEQARAGDPRTRRRR